MGRTKYWILAAGLVALAGCGGSGSDNNINTGTAPINGSTSSATKPGTSSATSVTAPAATPTSTTVTLGDGTTTTATIPGGITIPANSPVVLVPAAFPINLSPTTAPGLTRGGVAGQVWAGGSSSTLAYTGITIVDGQYSINGTSAITQPICLPANGLPFAIELYGSVSTGDSPTTGKPLTVLSGVLVTWKSFNTSSYPTSASYAFPSNGSPLGTTTSLELGFTGTAPTGTMWLYSGSNSIATKAGTASGSTLKFQNINNSASIPSAGLTSVVLSF